MRTFLILLLSLAALVVVAAVFVFDVFSEIGSHRLTGQQKAPFASVGMSREEYIEYLLRTENRNDPELWRRIAAVQNLKRWPK
ncbi:MAG: hypothetical protein WCG76_04545 [Verrucomicrobiota bacterium]|jgi:hypothetical protein